MLKKDVQEIRKLNQSCSISHLFSFFFLSKNVWKKIIIIIMTIIVTMSRLLREKGKQKKKR